MVYGLLDELKIGKYRGKRLIDVMRDEPRYVEWMYDNVDAFDLDEEALDWFEKFKANVEKSNGY